MDTGAGAAGTEVQFLVVAAKHDGMALSQPLLPRYIKRTLNILIDNDVAKHVELNGGQVSHAMMLYQLFTNAYVVDYFFFEEFVTSTWDIIAEKCALSNQ